MKNLGLRKKREYDFYVEFALEFQKKEMLTLSEMKSLINEVSDKLGYEKVTVKNTFKAIINSLKEVIEIRSTETTPEKNTTGVPGRACKDFIFELVKGKTREELIKTCEPKFGKRGKKISKQNKGTVQRQFSLTTEDHLIRNASLKLASILKATEDGLSHKGSLRKAEAILGGKRRIKGRLQNAYSLLRTSRDYPNKGILSGKKVREVVKSSYTREEVKAVIIVMDAFDINLGFEIQEVLSESFGWQLKVGDNTSTAIKRLEILLKSLNTEVPKFSEVTEQKVLTSSTEEVVNVKTTTSHVGDRYLAYIIASAITNSGKNLNIGTLCSLLGNSHYRNMTLTKREVVDFVRHNNKYFNISRDNIELIRGTWEELKEFSPKREEWKTVWVINSGLSLSEISSIAKNVRELGPCKGETKVVEITLDKSIKSIQKLARVFNKMRECDFPIDEELKNLLGKEIAYQNAIFIKAFKGEENLPMWASHNSNAEDTFSKDKYIYELEEMVD